MIERTGHREVIGERLKAFRESRGVSLYKLAKLGGISIGQAKAVESGSSNYTIDVFIGYIIGSDLYMFFSEKSENRQKPHDISDISVKAISEDPYR